MTLEGGSMNTSESLRALRKANPRSRVGFVDAVIASEEAVRARIAAPSPVAPEPTRPAGRRFLQVSMAGAVAVVVAIAASLTVGPLGGSGVESAAAAVERAAEFTAASADRSGTAVVRITHNAELWAGTTVHWHGNDVAVSRDAPTRPGRAGAELLVVDGILYGVEPGVEGGWIKFGSPDVIDPDSGTTPAEYLAAVREDTGGATLRRITAGMASPLTTHLNDGTTVYGGTVPAGLIARETGFKEGQEIRVFPFGLVAHDEAADPASPLDLAVTVGADGLIRSIVVSWGAGASTWRYSVTYAGLGTTAAPVAPENAQPMSRLRARSG
jgi:hypothetical protein